MSQKFIKSKNNNMRSNAFGKFFAKAVYDKAFIGTKQLAEFIQTQASVKRSDIIAVLDELGSAMKHFFELGQKVQLDGIGIFKVGFSSIHPCGDGAGTSCQRHRQAEVFHRQAAPEGCGLRGGA